MERGQYPSFQEKRGPTFAIRFRLDAPLEMKEAAN